MKRADFGGFEKLLYEEGSGILGSVGSGKVLDWGRSGRLRDFIGSGRLRSG